MVLKSMRGRVLPYIARGNALLAAGRPEPALIDFESALLLKPGLPEALAMKAGSCGFSQIPSYIAVTSAEPTL